MNEPIDHLAGGEIQALPWKRDQYGTVLDANGERVVLTGFSLNTGHYSKVAGANTDFVFRSCAAHRDLIVAVAQAVDKDLAYVDGEVRGITSGEVKALRAALAKAQA